MYPGTPRCTNLSKRPECLTLSKALDASRKHINKPPFKFLYLSTISFKTYIQVSVPSDCLKPNWLWQVSSNPDILNNRILSTTLDITLATMYHGEHYCTHTWVTPLHGAIIIHGFNSVPNAALKITISVPIPKYQFPFWKFDFHLWMPPSFAL